MDVTPGDTIDFGGIEPAKQQTRSVWLSPDPAAAALKPTISLVAEGTPEGTSVRFDPPRVTLDQKRQIKVTLTAGPRAGSHRLRIRLSCDSPAVRLRVTELAATYSAEAALITIDARKLHFERVLGEEAAPSVRVRVAATQGAIGRTVRLRWRFGDLPEGMVITPSPEQITLSQPAETVTLTLALKGASPGSYEGRVAFEADVKVQPAELGVLLDVTTQQIEVLDPPKPWSVGLSAWRAAGAAELALVLKANSAADGVTVTFEPEDALPDGIRIAAEPRQLKLATGPNTVKLNAEASVPLSFLGRTYSGSLRLTTDSPRAAVHPQTLEWEVVVAPLWPHVAWAGGVVLLLAIALCWLWWPRRLMGRLTIQFVPAGGSVMVDEVPYEAHGEIILETRGVKIGPGERCAIVLGSRGAEAESPGEWTVRLRRRRRTWLQRSAKAAQAVSVQGTMDGEPRPIEIRQRIALEHGDTIQIDRFAFLYEET